MITITVSLPDGKEQVLEAKESGTVMEALRDAAVPIRAACGGAMACATCHVHVAPQWQDRVGAAGDEEADLLDDSDYHSSASRLCCQINCANTLDGLNVALQLDALED